jgi:hypothetical protein
MPTTVKIACKQLDIFKPVLLKNNFIEISENVFKKGDIKIIINSKVPAESKLGEDFYGAKFNIPYPVVKYLERLYGHEWKTL